jgi:hypothetical protein
MKPLDLDIADFPKDFDWHNDQFPPLDALTYWHFLSKAKRVIEIGCGYSTWLSSRANVELTAIDPLPRVIYPNIEYVRSYVQDVYVDTFDVLDVNDILFIDSSHIYEDGSDVHFLIHEILPKLKKGVLIHFHDYFGMYGYPKAWLNDLNMRLWNENDIIIRIVHDYEVLAFNYLISENNNQELKSKYDFVTNNIISNLGAVKGASLWLKK